MVGPKNEARERLLCKILVWSEAEGQVLLPYLFSHDVSWTFNCRSEQLMNDGFSCFLREKLNRVSPLFGGHNDSVQTIV